MVKSGWVKLENRNTDNRANSAQFQTKLPTGAELGKRTAYETFSHAFFLFIFDEATFYNLKCSPFRL